MLMHALHQTCNMHEKSDINTHHTLYIGTHKLTRCKGTVFWAIAQTFAQKKSVPNKKILHLSQRKNARQ